MDKETMEKLKNQLYTLIVSLDSVEECGVLFEDLCTFKEVEQMAIRVQAARMLIDGATYNKIIEETGISSATLSRVSRCVNYGSGGYVDLLKK